MLEGRSNRGFKKRVFVISACAYLFVTYYMRLFPSEVFDDGKHLGEVGVGVVGTAGFPHAGAPAHLRQTAEKFGKVQRSCIHRETETDNGMRR